MAVLGHHGKNQLKRAAPSRFSPCRCLLQRHKRLFTMVLIVLQVERQGDFGEGTVSVDLIEDGGALAVSDANREGYVTLYVEHLLLKSVEKQRKAFCAGFHKVGSCLLTPWRSLALLGLCRRVECHH